jgi:hypothetical protein
MARKFRKRSQKQAKRPGDAAQILPLKTQKKQRRDNRRKSTVFNP